MSAAKLQTDATFRDLSLPRKEGEIFLRKLVGTMRAAAKDFGPVTVRMGVTGTGQEPNYRFENASGLPVRAINGANHSIWDEGSKFDGSGTWSTETMTLTDVESELARLSGYVQPKNK